jgi:hypothetical protein
MQAIRLFYGLAIGLIGISCGTAAQPRISGVVFKVYTQSLNAEREATFVGLKKS